MAVKIGNSYVSEAALSFAKSNVSDDDNILKSLSEKFPNLKISVGTAPFSGSGTNNLSISPKVLQEMQNNPEKRVEYEALIYDIASGNNSRAGVKSAGFIIGDDGGLRGWSISDGGDKKNTSLNKKDKKTWWQKLLPENKKTPAAKVEISKKKTFASTNELMKTLQEKFSVVKNGSAVISKKFLQDSLTDETKQQKLFENLQAAEENFKSREGEVGFLGMKVEIDAEGNMSVESSSGKVAFNESKRARQISAAKSADDVQYILNLLDTDLTQCEDGVKNNMCDEEEVKKVKAMIERAKQKLHEVEKNPPQENLSAVDVLI